MLQEDDLDVLGAFTNLLRTTKELDRLSSKGLDHWPTYTATLKKLTVTDDGETTFQLTPLTHVTGAKEHYSSHCERYCSFCHQLLEVPFEMVRPTGGA